MAPEAFGVEGYFEAYVKYVQDCHQAQAEGQDLELVEFLSPTVIEGGLEMKKPCLWTARPQAQTPKETDLGPPKVVNMMKTLTFRVPRVLVPPFFAPYFL